MEETVELPLNLTPHEDIAACTNALSVDGVLQIIDEIDHKNQRSLVKSIVDILGYTMEEIRSSDKHNAIAFARHFLSRYLHDNGWTLSAIGRSINPVNCCLLMT